MEIHRILCQCRICKGEKENKNYLQLKEGKEKGYFEMKIKGILFSSTKLKIKEQDIINCLNKIKELRTLNNRKK
ncbi:hypothetical protein LCGC14_2042660 [marine sediment metagenome]|uniref:Uncharacterized protein n=1 Tax=marine sediment metagenome TaxID=412755 RepID=A0A0F9HND9_9ZZZZ